jgi:glycine cleavage system regulatory protein
VEASLVLTILGLDRPGLVEAVSQTIADHGGSWQESRMARLAGRFAGVLRVSVDEAQADKLGEALRGLESTGLAVMVERSAEVEAAGDLRALVLDLVGHDRPGIVRDISSALAERGVNVIELHTHVSSAPMSGEPLFNATAHLRSPQELKLPELREILERIADDLMVEITIGEPSDRAS